MSPAVLLLPALFFCTEFAFDNGRQYTISLVSSIVHAWKESFREVSSCNQKSVRELQKSRLLTYLYNAILGYIGFLYSTHVPSSFPFHKMQLLKWFKNIIFIFLWHIAQTWQLQWKMSVYVILLVWWLYDYIFTVCFCRERLSSHVINRLHAKTAAVPDKPVSRRHVCTL